MAEYAKDLTAEILGDRSYPVGYPIGEVYELAEALWQKDFSAIAEEFQDAAYACQMYVWQRLGVNAPVLFARSAIRKFRERNNVWKALFEAKGVAFDLRYLVGGSNFAKPAKIIAAFNLAGVTVSEVDARNMSSMAQSLYR